MADGVADLLRELKHELIVATRILANQKVLDAFGHVSVRHPRDPGRYFISRHQAPELAEVSDLDRNGSRLAAGPADRIAHV